jgi:hypothetical protein
MTTYTRWFTSCDLLNSILFYSYFSPLRVLSVVLTTKYKMKEGRTWIVFKGIGSPDKYYFLNAYTL